MYSGILQQVAY